MARSAPRPRKPAYTAAYLEADEDDYGETGLDVFGGAESDEEGGRGSRRRVDEQEEVR